MSTEKGHSLKAAAAIVMSSVIISRFTGYIREMLIPTKLGIGKVSDAYNIGFLIPDLMYSLLVGGAISAALIPVLSAYIEKKDESEGWKAVSTFINVSFIAIIIACILGMIFAPAIIPVIAAGYSRDLASDMLPLIVKLTRILLPSVSFLMLAGICNGILNSYKKFAAAAYGPSIYNLLSAVSILFLSNQNAADNYGVVRVAFGVMISAAGYFFLQLAFAFKHMGKYKLLLNTKLQGFRKLIKLALPSLATSSVMQINIIISASFASLFAAGAVTAFKMADRTWQMPLGIIAQGMGVAILPTLASRYASGKFDDYSRTLSTGLKTVLLLCLPSAVGFVILNQPIIRTIFKFSAKVSEGDVSLTASLLAVFSIALIAQSVSTILNRGFFARNDTKTPLYISMSTIAVNILLNFIFYWKTSLGVTGMALSYSIAGAVNAVLLIMLLAKVPGGLDIRGLSGFLVKVVPACALMSAALFAVNLYIPLDVISSEVSLFSKVLQLLFLIGEIIIGTVVYFTICIILRVEEAITIKDTVIRRLRALTSKH